MKQACTFIALCFSSWANAQLVNGSFENVDGWDLTGWTSSCQNAFFGIGQPDNGNWSTSVPHGETNGSCYASNLVQFVPAIQDGATWTLDGWCHNMLTGFSDPYIGIGMGIKHEDGWWEYFTSAQMNTGNWTHLSVTNSFSMAAGDTAFVILNAGIVSGNGTGAWAEFDGFTLTDLSTGLQGEGEHNTPAFIVDRSTGTLRVELTGPVSSILLVDAIGREQVLRTVHHTERTLEVDMSSIPPGSYVMRMTTASGIRTLRFINT